MPTNQPHVSLQCSVSIQCCIPQSQYFCATPDSCVRWRLIRWQVAASHNHSMAHTKCVFCGWRLVRSNFYDITIMRCVLQLIHPRTSRCTSKLETRWAGSFVAHAREGSRGGFIFRERSGAVKPNVEREGIKLCCLSTSYFLFVLNLVTFNLDSLDNPPSLLYWVYYPSYTISNQKSEIRNQNRHHVH